MEEVTKHSTKPRWYSWAVAGDFNVVRFSDEKIGGIDLSYNQLREFNECMDLCSLADIRSTGGIWTWNNKGIGPVRMLPDRVICNTEWIDMLPHFCYKYLNHSTSDHSPMILRLDEQPKSLPKIFRYYNFWADSNGFEQLVKDNWGLTVHGHMQYQVGMKLKENETYHQVMEGTKWDLSKKQNNRNKKAIG